MDVVDDVWISQVANKVVLLIKRRTLSGQFLPGSSTGAGEYSAGYKKTRELAGRPTDKVTMIWSGRYMRDLSILTAKKASAEIGWKDDRNKTLSRYHESEGAGKNRRLHKQLGLADEELTLIEKEFGAELVTRVSDSLTKETK